MSSDAIREMVDQGVFVLPEGSDIDKLVNNPDQLRNRKDPEKRQAHAAGVKTKGVNKFAMIYWVMAKLDFGGEHKEEAYIYFAGQDEIVGIIKNPLWSAKRPVMSKPVERLKGSFFRPQQGRAGEIPAMAADRFLERGPGLGDVLAAAGDGRPIR